MVLGLLLADRVTGNYSADTRVLVCSQTSLEDGLSEKYAGYGPQKDIGTWCMERLITEPADGTVFEEGFVFIYEENEDELVRKVSMGEVSCGLVFADDAVRVYQSAGSTDGYVLEEMIYPLLKRYMSYGELAEYAVDNMQADEYSDTDEISSRVADRYSEYLDNMDLTLYEVNKTGVKVCPESSFDKNKTRLMRYVFVFMIILIASLCTYDTINTDRAFYRAFSKTSRKFFMVLRVAVSVVMSTTVATFSFFLINTLL